MTRRNHHRRQRHQRRLQLRQRRQQRRHNRPHSSSWWANTALVFRAIHWISSRLMWPASRDDIPLYMCRVTSAMWDISGTMRCLWIGRSSSPRPVVCFILWARTRILFMDLMMLFMSRPMPIIDGLSKWVFTLSLSIYLLLAYSLLFALFY